MDGYCPLMIYNTTVLPSRQGSRGHSIRPSVPARALRPAIERPQVTGLHLPAVSTNIAAAMGNAGGDVRDYVSFPCSAAVTAGLLFGPAQDDLGR